MFCCFYYLCNSYLIGNRYFVKMKKCIFSFISILLLGTVLFSCKDEISGKDKLKPVISDIKVNWERAVRIKIDSLKIDTLIVTNRETSETGARIDTLIKGDTLFFSAHMSDDYQLSTFILRIFKEGLPTIEEAGGDTAYTKFKVWSEIYGVKDTIIENLRAFPIPDSISKNIEGKNVQINVASGDYIFRVVCMDTFGRTDSVDHDVYVLHRDSLLK